jgi:AcrR family transcriptional regulator
VAAPRRRDAESTRQRIVTTARRNFAARGYDRATVRMIAAEAGVSPNLITRYFGGKQGLFSAATEVDLHVVDILAGPKNKLGHRIAAHTVARWEASPGDDPLLTMLRAAMNDPTAAAHMAEFFRVQASEPLTRHLGGRHADERAAAVSAFIMGTVVQRYVLHAGPMAQATPAELTGWLGRALQRLLAEPG